MQRFDDWSTDRRVTHAGVTGLPRRRVAPLADAFSDSTWCGPVRERAASSGHLRAGRGRARRSSRRSTCCACAGLPARGVPADSVWAPGQRYAFVAATGGHFAGVASVERLRRVGATMAIDGADAPWLRPRSRRPLGAECRCAELMRGALEAFEPTVLISYPSCADPLARGRRSTGRLDLRLSEVWVGGEQLRRNCATRVGAQGLSLPRSATTTVHRSFIRWPGNATQGRHAPERRLARRSSRSKRQSRPVPPGRPRMPCCSRTWPTTRSRCCATGSDDSVQFVPADAAPAAVRSRSRGAGPQRAHLAAARRQWSRGDHPAAGRRNRHRRTPG